MLEFKDLFNEDIVFLDSVYTDKIDLLTRVSEELTELGYVKESFKDALIEREGLYPTGLPTVPFQVAIPHADPVHIHKPYIAVVRPTENVNFVEMGQVDKEVYAEFIFVLGMMKSEYQIELLQKLLDFFMNEENMSALKKADSKSELLLLLRESIGN